MYDESWKMTGCGRLRANMRQVLDLQRVNRGASLGAVHYDSLLNPVFWDRKVKVAVLAILSFMAMC
jgi:hypothetical protein